MLSRLRRSVALVPVVLLPLTALAACGGDDSEKTAQGFDAVSVSGEPGELPEIEWSARLASGEKDVEVTEGDGAELAKGDRVLTNIAISDDYTQQIDAETYGADQAGYVIEVGAKQAEPSQPSDLITSLIAEQVKPGATLGTRIAMTIDVQEEWGDTAFALVDLGIGNEDGIVVVADLEATPLSGPHGTKQAAPAWAPQVEEAKGAPTGLDFTGVTAPDAKAKQVDTAVLIKGKGPKVAKGDLAVVDYLGQTYDGEEPFDESYSKGTPLDVNVGDGVTGGGTNVIQGWSQGLVGVPVGSRVLLRIPPSLGYGKQGQGEDIPPNSTLYFVVDVLAAA